MTTATDALDLLLASIQHAPNDDLLTDTLTRLGLLCGARSDSEICLAKFEAPLRAERGRLRLIEGIRVAKRIGI